MLKKSSFHWAAPLSAMFSLVPPFCSHWPGQGPGGGHGGSAHAGGAGEAGAAAAGAGGATSEDLPVIGCPAGVWPETAQLQTLDVGEFGDAGLTSGNGEYTVGYNERGPIFWSGTVVTEVELAYASFPRAVTCDGSLVIGNINDSNVAFRALRSGTFSYLETPTDDAWTTQEDVSEDGVGLGNHRYPQPTQPVEWDTSGALSELLPLRGLEARRISPDGQTIWGVAHDCETDCTYAIFRYSAAEGVTRYPMGGVPGTVEFANDGSAAFDLAEDGSAPLPYDAPRPIHRFDSSTGTMSSFECPAARRCWPVAVSSQAAVVFFNSTRPPGAVFVDAWVWDQAHGTRSLPQLLMQLGLSVPGDLATVGVSDDARVFSGSNYRGVPGPFVPFRIVVPRGTFY